MAIKLKSGLVLTLLGLIGVLSLLTVDFPMDNLPKLVTERYSATQIKWLILINPTLLMIIGVLVGTALHEQCHLQVPTIHQFITKIPATISFYRQFQSGIVYGIISGIIITLITVFFQAFLPPEFFALGSKMNITPAARLLYGGITEELLMRYGFMTFVVWIIFKIRKELSTGTYIIGILLSSLMFAAGHLPVVYSSVASPDVMLISYIILGNSAAGILFGYQYWKKGLEAAMIAHMFAHLTMLAAEKIIHIS